MLKEKTREITNQAYLLLNMILVAITLFYNFKFENQSLEIFVITFYIAISCLSIYCYYTSKKVKNYLWLITLSFALFLPSNWFFMIPMIGLTLLSISSKFKTFTRLILPFFLVVFIIKISLGFYIQSMDLRSEYSRVVNENNSYALVTYMVDTGALGVDFPVYLEWDFLNVLKVEKRVGILQGNNKILWIDENTYSIDGEITDI